MASSISSGGGASFDPRVLGDLDKWVRSKGGKVQARLISEFYHKHSPEYKEHLQNRLHALADCEQSKVHVVQGSTSATASLEFLELKQLGSRPLKQPLSKTLESQKQLNGAHSKQSDAATSRSPALPAFSNFDGIEYALVRDPATARAQLQAWAPLEPFAFDFKGDIRKDGRIALIQVSNRNKQVLMIDLVDNPRMPDESGLKDHFQDSEKVKVILDCARPVEALRWIWGIEIVNVFDLSRSYIITKTGEAPAPGEQGASLVMMVNELRLPFTRVGKPEDSWFRRPLSSLQIEYSIRGVFQNMVIYDRIVERATERGLMDACIYESARHAQFMRSGGDDRENEDWSCLVCGFENFRRRYACRKCDTPKPSVAPPAKRIVTTPAKSKSAILGGRSIVEEDLAKKEEEEMRRALEESLKDEQARLEKAKREQYQPKKDENLKRQQQREALEEDQLESAGATTTGATSLFSLDDNDFPDMPSPNTLSSQFAATLGMNDFSLPFSPPSSSLGVNLSSFLRGPQSSSVASSSLFSEPAPNARSSFESTFLPTFPPAGGMGLSPSLVTPSTVTSRILPPTDEFGGMPHRILSPPPSSTQTPATSSGSPSSGMPRKPQGLSDDEFLLLSLDTSSLLKDLNMDPSLADVVVQCAVKAGAKCELVEAPLPLFAKAMEQGGLSVNQRAMILKELHAMKNRQTKVG